MTETRVANETRAAKGTRALNGTRARLPGPSSHPWLQTIGFSQDPLGYVRACSRRFGDTYALRMAGLDPVILFSEPDAVRQIFGLPAAEIRNGNDVVRYLLHDRSIIFLVHPI